MTRNGSDVVESLEIFPKICVFFPFTIDGSFRENSFGPGEQEHGEVTHLITTDDINQPLTFHKGAIKHLFIS